MEEIDLKEMIQFFWKKKVIILLVGVLAIIMGVIYTMFCITPEFATAASLILTETEFKSEADVIAYSKLVDRYTTVANGKNVAERVINNLKLDMTASELQKCITVIGSPGSYCITIKAEYTEPELAAKIADEMIKSLIEEINNIYKDTKVQVLDSADINYNPQNVNMFENLVTAFIIGIVICCGCILILYVYKDSKKSKDEKK